MANVTEEGEDRASRCDLKSIISGRRLEVEVTQDLGFDLGQIEVSWWCAGGSCDSSDM